METNEVVEEQGARKRGFWLSSFLILMLILNSVAAFMYFSDPDMIVEAYPDMTEGMPYLLGAIAIVNIVLAAGIWMWKKWAVYGLYAAVATAFFVNLYVGVGVMASLIGTVGALLIYVTTKSRWEHFS